MQRYDTSAVCLEDCPHDANYSDDAQGTIHDYMFVIMSMSQ